MFSLEERAEMNARVSSLIIGMIVVVASITLATSIARATSRHSSLACGSGTVDMVCLVNPSLSVRPKPGTVSSAGARRLAPGSNVTTSTGGVADISFRHHTLCRMMAPTPRGTSLRTRYPFTRFLFTQRRGETICTLPDLTVIGVLGSRSFRLSSLHRGASAPRELFGPSAAPFNAVLETTAGATQLRIKFVPGKFFSAAVQQGGLLVGLSNYSTPTLGPGDEQTITLNAQNQITASTTNPATFTPTEMSTFDLQLKKGG
jgi:hypothetical protein